MSTHVRRWGVDVLTSSVGQRPLSLRPDAIREISQPHTTANFDHTGGLVQGNRLERLQINDCILSASSSLLLSYKVKPTHTPILPPRAKTRIRMPPRLRLDLHPDLPRAHHRILHMLLRGRQHNHSRFVRQPEVIRLRELSVRRVAGDLVRDVFPLETLGCRVWRRCRRRRRRRLGTTRGARCGPVVGPAVSKPGLASCSAVRRRGSAPSRAAAAVSKRAVEAGLAF